MNLFINKEDGFVALISAIIISVVLLTITVILNFSSFFGRFNILDSEFKETSIGLAESCIDSAMIEIAKDSNFTVSARDIYVGVDKCTIVSVQNNNPVSGQSTIKTMAIFNKSVSNFKAVVNSSTIQVISWQECANGCP